MRSTRRARPWAAFRRTGCSRSTARRSNARWGRARSAPVDLFWHGGRLPSIAAIGLALLLRIEGRAATGRLLRARIELHPSSRKAIQNGRRRDLARLESEYDIEIGSCRRTACWPGGAYRVARPSERHPRRLRPAELAARRHRLRSSPAPIVFEIAPVGPPGSANNAAARPASETARAKTQRRRRAERKAPPPAWRATRKRRNANRRRADAGADTRTAIVVGSEVARNARTTTAPTRRRATPTPAGRPKDRPGAAGRRRRRRGGRRRRGRGAGAAGGPSGPSGENESAAAPAEVSSGIVES